jgi:hypothetical protein
MSKHTDKKNHVAKNHVVETIEAPLKVAKRERRIVAGKNPAINSAIVAVRDILNAKAKFQKEARDFDAKYVGIDSKGSLSTFPGYSDRIKLFDDQIAVMKSTMSSAIGTQIVKIRLAAAFNFPVSGAGLMNAVLPVDPSAISEFNSIALLFSEYRVLGGVMSFVNCLQSGDTSITGSHCYLAVLSYDPATAFTLSSVPVGTQNVQHKLYAVNMLHTGGGSDIIHRGVETFRFLVPKGTLTSNATTQELNANWQPTLLGAGGSYIPYGTVSSFADSLSVVSATGLSGVLVYDVEVRMRA